MPLARMMLSMSQRCSSKRRTCGSPRLSRTGCGWLITFIASLPIVRPANAGGATSLAVHCLEDRRPAREFVLENARCLVGPDAEHRLEPESDELGLKGGIGHRVLGCRVEPIEDRSRRAGRRKNPERGLRHHVRQSRFD